MNLKTFLAIFLLVAFIACNPSDGGKDDSPSEPPTTSEPSPTPAPTDPPTNPPNGPGGEPPISEPPSTTDPAPTPAPDPSPEVPPDPADTFRINITYGGTHNTAARREKYARAVSMMKKIVATREFRDRIYAHEYGSNDFAHMSSDPCKTDDCVYQHILDGNEKLSNTKDNEMDLEVRFYYANNSTVGYTYANVKYIYVNTKFFDGYALSSVCANMMHEWLHKLGYGHDSSSTARRPYSIPYAVGSIVRSVGKTL